MSIFIIYVYKLNKKTLVRNLKIIKAHNSVILIYYNGWFR